MEGLHHKVRLGDDIPLEPVDGVSGTVGGFKLDGLACDDSEEVLLMTFRSWDPVLSARPSSLSDF